MNFLSNKTVTSYKQESFKSLQTKLIKSHPGLKHFHHLPGRKCNHAIKPQTTELVLCKPSKVETVNSVITSYIFRPAGLLDSQEYRGNILGLVLDAI